MKEDDVVVREDASEGISGHKVEGVDGRVEACSNFIMGIMDKVGK